MADVTINSLDPATNVQAADLFVLWQQASNTAKSISGQNFTNWLVAYADGHGGIQSIAKTSSSGSNPVVDVYTITYADESSDTFSVTNGVKGDTGASTYVYVRYSDEEPTSDSDIGVLPAPWMGVYVGLEDDPNDLHYTDYTWYQIKGTKGDTGDGITSVTRTTGDGSPGTTDVYTMYAEGTSVGQFSVYNGLNGTGSVSAVNGVYPDGNGNVELTEEDIPHRTLANSSILLIGDSYNYGTGGVSGCGWGYYFNQQNSVSATIIHQDGGGFAAVGNSSAQYEGLNYASVISQMSASPSYNLVIAQAGWNDSSSRNSGGAAAVVTGVNAFVTNVRAKWPNAEIIIIPTLSGVATSAHQEECMNAICNTAYLNAVRSTSQSYLWMAGKGMTASDGIHLTDAGYQLLAKLITRFALGWDGVLDYPGEMTGTVSNGEITPTTTTDNFYLRRVGSIVYLMIRFVPNVQKSDLLVCTLPEGFRPSARVVYVAFRVWSRSASSDPDTLAGIIETGGSVRINTSGAACSSDYFAQISFPLCR